MKHIKIFVLLCLAQINWLIYPNNADPFAWFPEELKKDCNRSTEAKFICEAIKRAMNAQKFEVNEYTPTIEILYEKGHQCNPYYSTESYHVGRSKETTYRAPYQSYTPQITKHNTWVEEQKILDALIIATQKTEKATSLKNSASLNLQTQYCLRRKEQIAKRLKQLALLNYSILPNLSEEQKKDFEEKRKTLTEQWQKELEMAFEDYNKKTQSEQKPTGK